MKNVAYIILSILLISSCEETIILDTDQTMPKTIVEAVVTNQPGRQYVHLRRTVDFYHNGDIPTVSGATVSVTDSRGVKHDYIESTEQPGYYTPSPPFVGEVGLTYTLSISALGESFTASDELLPVTSIDSLSYAIDEDEQEDPEDPGKFYVSMLYMQEPQDEDNYYRFRFYRNGKIQNNDGRDITITDDTGVGESIDGIESPYFYQQGDTARVEMISLSRAGFVYFSDFANLIFSDGGIFSPLPANPRTNISGGALGVFQVSSIAIGEVLIE